MEYAKIVVKDSYECEGDLVLRNYINAIKDLNINLLLGLNLFTNTETAFIFGIIKDDHQFHELFTDRIINYDNYVLVPDDGVIPLKYLSKDEVFKIRQVINNIIFGENINFLESKETDVSKKYIKK